MRIVIDLQGAQSTSKDRGIGRYSMAIAMAILRNRGEHDVLLALNGLFPDTIEPIRAAFDGWLPQENIRVWEAVEPIAQVDPANEWRRKTAELIREAFLASLSPDVVLITSLFEGFADNAVTSVRRMPGDYATAVTLYDLIPYIHHKLYLESPSVESWYFEKIEHLKRADLWLTISDSTRQEGVFHLGLANDRSVNISTDADIQFKKCTIKAEEQLRLRKKYGIKLPFIMYTGGIDYRKNIEGLIRAYAKLPHQLRQSHQLAIVCAIQPDSRQRLEQLAFDQGLQEAEIIFTGYLPDADLITLYNLCVLFVFPSLHEGFGLPALEAMRCGAPVIGANAASLPEVIGLPEALFDPHSDEAIAQIIVRALTDESFLQRLIAHGEVQSTKFCWDTSGRRAIQAMERVVCEHSAKQLSGVSQPTRPRMAYFSPLPPEQSGIAAYSAELLPALSEYYEIEVVVVQDTVSDPWIIANCPIRSLQWFEENISHYERVIYHFGNSSFHKHMFRLARNIPGVVVLHDFFLSDVLQYMELSGYQPNCFVNALLYSHGYNALKTHYTSSDPYEAAGLYPCSLDVIQFSRCVITHSQYSYRLSAQWYGEVKIDWTIIPLLRETNRRFTKAQAREALGIAIGDFVVCSFGMLGPTKLNHRLLQAWLNSSLVVNSDCHLVFVGLNQPVHYASQLLDSITSANVSANIRITGWIDEQTFHQYLAAADLAVQLRTQSRGETSAAVLDCMNYELPTIVNANGSMAEMGHETVWMLPDEFTDQELVNALELFWRDQGFRAEQGRRAREAICQVHNPTHCAQLYRCAIEQSYNASNGVINLLISAIAESLTNSSLQADVHALANAMAFTFPHCYGPKQLLVDISVLVQCDAKTGIQRVVRSVLREWLESPPHGWRVEPVFATVDSSYRYARTFTAKFLGMSSDSLKDEPIDYKAGDVFFGLDLSPLSVINNASFLRRMFAFGVDVRFMVYDLLPIEFPSFWLPQTETSKLHSEWLSVVGGLGGAICISRAVADDLRMWIDNREWLHKRPFVIDWVHLGADIEASVPSKGMPDNANEILACLRRTPSFLMIGTLEPRKGYVQVLDAFEQLWQDGYEINLVIVAKQGWMVDDLVHRMSMHSERDKCLFWLEGISDEYLQNLYDASSCLIAASYGEGFGLPLIEAAQHKLPILARDITVFREVGGEHAYYFNGMTSHELSNAIRSWLSLYETGQHPQSDGMPWLTWRESAQHLLNILRISTFPEPSRITSL